MSKKSQTTTQTYTSAIVLGATYQDVLSGFEGVAIYVTFNLTGCERVALDRLDAASSELKAYEFDATRLEFVKAPSDKVKALAKVVEEESPGGPTSRARRV